MTVRRLAARDCLQSCGLTSKGLSLCLFELNYIGCEAERQKLRMSSRCEVILLRRHSPFIFHIKLCKIAIGFLSIAYFIGV